MKKNTIFSLLCASLLTASCGEGFLDVAPADQLSDATFWKTPADAASALTGCYRGWEAATNVVFLDAATDNGYEQFNYLFQPIGNGQMLPTSGTGDSAPWVDGSATRWFTYDRIRKYNNFLEKAENFAIDAETKARYMAEVRFLRAYDYYNKVMFYGDVPLVTSVINDVAEATLSRTPEAEVAAFVLKELAEVAEVLPEQNQITSQGHITRGAALALKARFELYRGDYAAAQADAAKVIGMGCYELYPDYETLFYPEAKNANKESILDVQYIKDKYASMIPQLNLPAIDGGWSALNALWPFIDFAQMSNGMNKDAVGSGYNDSEPFLNRDPRLTKIVLCPGQPYNGRIYNPLDKAIDGTNNDDYHVNAAASRGGLLVKKFIYPMTVDDMNNYDANFMIIRLAEMYITFAECALQTGTDVDKALDYLNAIRQRAGMPAASVLTEELVKYERRMELAFEGLRYFDIKRWDLGAATLHGPALGSRDGSVNASTGALSLTDEHIVLEERVFLPERKYLLPIPQAELDRNANMTQNAGY